jgi:hypothetical protein
MTSHVIDSDSSGSEISEESNCSEIESLSSFDRLPAVVLKRVNALLKLHSEKQIIDQNFFIEVHKLEKKFEESYGPLFAKRNKIVSGVYEPEKSDLSSNDIIHSKDNGNRPETSKTRDIKGIPGFWLKVLKNYKSISQSIQEYDEPILQNLVDIKVIRNVDPMRVSLEFHFKPNEYFTNEVLTKEFYLSIEPESDWIRTPVSCKSTKIDWKEGKDVTKQFDTKGKGKKSTQMKASPRDSFFNYFIQSQEELDPEESEESLRVDWIIARNLCSYVVPNAVLYFNGQELEYSDSEESDVQSMDFSDNSD